MPGERHLGVAVDAPRHLVVVHWNGAIAKHVLDNQNSLGEPDVGELCSVDNISNGPYPRN